MPQHSAQPVHQEGCHREARRETYLSQQMRLLSDQAQGTRYTHHLLGACNRSRKICSPQCTPYTAMEDGQREEVMFQRQGVQATLEGHTLQCFQRVSSHNSNNKSLTDCMADGRRSLGWSGREMLTWLTTGIALGTGFSHNI